MISDKLFLLLGMRDASSLIHDVYEAVAGLFLSPDALSVYAVICLAVLLHWLKRQTTT